MRLESTAARERFAARRVARLATITPGGLPHIVPIVYTVVGDIVYTGIDAKPKTTTSLQRLANIAANPAVALLADHYSDDWTQLWWVRADGTARIADADEARTAERHLAARYSAYATQPLIGPIIAIDVTRWSGWCAS
ncbi:TIGR03668 family PPOX class F420-dependent oxidoreductase [Nocardia sp. NPDC050710]|uniref:TIGR03668 family PPOX class F420-dependent oxidoreductase n=1 Tax=Nocardia sp. NPDC050710 TaxID=3157220 RepID=UPI0033D31A6C